MKISVRSGDVPVRGVTVFLHSRGIYSVDVKTPFDARVGVLFGETAEKSTGICTTVEIYAPLRDEPTKITLEPEIDRERLALMGWLTYECKGGLLVILAVPDCLLDRRGKIAGAWDPPNAQVDYLERFL